MGSPFIDALPPEFNCSLCPRESVIESKPRGITYLRCGHSFHFECINRVINEKKMECPSCGSGVDIECGQGSPEPTNDEVDPCGICLDGVIDHLRGITTYKCGHRFHLACAFKWCVHSSGVIQCPTCRGVERTANNSPPHQEAGSQEGMDDDEASALALSLEPNRYTIWVESRTRANNGANNGGLANQSGIRSGARQGQAASFFDSHN